ncbi:MAG: hypothetical protein JXB00_16175 [Bacteroidales bacterium]|nr:hypothetical protein [Bacteroidales bacterium]
MLWGTSYNYVEIIIDSLPPYRIRTNGRQNDILAGECLGYGEHTITIVKNTEANIGYLKFRGLSCEELLMLPGMPSRKIEFIGNSITCGTGSDTSEVSCNSGQWHDQHNAYMSYGSLTARALNAEWHLSAYSGVGLVHSCCGLQFTMPQIYDKVNFREDSIAWDFSRYIPDVVTICLGQNDGVQDSSVFCSAYSGFIKKIRSHYPHAYIVCLTSPMADNTLNTAMKKYLSAVEAALHAEGDSRVHKFFFSKSYNGGCDNHPSLEEHKLIAGELTAFIRSITGW